MRNFGNGRLLRVALLVLVVYASWLLMMAVHELGHVLNAWLSGGRVARVHFGLFEFSETELSQNPHPQFVAWGGPIWGCLIPLAVFAVARRRHARRQRYFCFFAGLCLIANGAYIGIGWLDAAGDAGTLLREGVPIWLMAVVGLPTLAAGLYLGIAWEHGSVLSAAQRRQMIPGDPTTPSNLKPPLSHLFRPLLT